MILSQKKGVFGNMRDPKGSLEAYRDFLQAEVCGQALYSGNQRLYLYHSSSSQNSQIDRMTDFYSDRNSTFSQGYTDDKVEGDDEDDEVFSDEIEENAGYKALDSVGIKGESSLKLIKVFKKNKYAYKKRSLGATNDNSNHGTSPILTANPFANTSLLHKSVSDQLGRMQVHHFNEIKLCDVYTVDIVVPASAPMPDTTNSDNDTANGTRGNRNEKKKYHRMEDDRETADLGVSTLTTVIEVDGPAHFDSYQHKYLGPDLLRYRHLELMGFKVMKVNYEQWSHRRRFDQSKAYLEYLFKCISS